MKTTRNCFITTIHGITGQEIEEGTLPTGSRVRKIYSENTPEGVQTSFECSTDNGKHWYKATTFDLPEGLFTPNPRSKFDDETIIYSPELLRKIRTVASSRKVLSRKLTENQQIEMLEIHHPRNPYGFWFLYHGKQLLYDTRDRGSVVITRISP